MSTDGRHRAEAASRRPQHTRLIIAGVLLCVGVLLLVGGQGTFARWTDQGTVAGGGFSSGKLDLTLDQGEQGNPSPYAKTELALSKMVPGESVAATLKVNNVGDADFDWTYTLTKGGGLGDALEVKVFFNSVRGGTDTTYPRNEQCYQGSLLGENTPKRLNRTATQTLCVQVVLPPTTDNKYQNVSSGSVSLALTAEQVIP